MWHILPFASVPLITKTFADLKETANNCEVSTEIIRPLPIQQRELERYHDSRFLIVNWPTGSGKTKFLQMKALLDAKRCNHRTIIAVPQHLIAKGFRESCEFEVFGQRYEWHGNLISDILRFLNEPVVSSTAHLVTTHQALICAFAKAGGSLNFSDTTLIIDECHHVNLGSDECNRLSDVVNYALRCRSDKTSVVLASATFSRGDCYPIVSDEYRDLFDVSEVLFSEYWSTLRHLHEYSYNYAFYAAGELQETFKQLLCKSDVRALVFIPPENSTKLGCYTKQQLIELCYDCAAEAGLKKRQIADFTVQSKARRLATMDKLANEKGTNDGTRLVLACGMFREGADWPAANTIIDFAPSFSSTERRQKFGRATRDYAGKNRFDYFVVLPESDANDQERCNEYYGHLIFSLVDQNFYSASALSVEPVEKVSELFEKALAINLELGDTDDEYTNQIIEDLVSEVFGDTPDKEEKVKAVVNTLHSIPRSLPTDLMRTLGMIEVVPKAILGLFKEFAASNGGLETFKRFEKMTADERYIAKIYADAYDC